MHKGNKFNGKSYVQDLKNKRQSNYPRCYVDSAELGGKANYATYNFDMLEMLWNLYNLAKCEERIFLYIVAKYDNTGVSKGKPLELSYVDIANAVNCSIDGAKAATRYLVRNCHLLLKVGKRNGRGKSKYMPNVWLIKATLSHYFDTGEWKIINEYDKPEIL